MNIDGCCRDSSGFEFLIGNSLSFEIALPNRPDLFVRSWNLELPHSADMPPIIGCDKFQSASPSIYRKLQELKHLLQRSWNIFSSVNAMMINDDHVRQLLQGKIQFQFNKDWFFAFA